MFSLRDGSNTRFRGAWRYRAKDGGPLRDRLALQ
jgi:hypothetical protein